MEDHVGYDAGLGASGRRNARAVRTDDAGPSEPAVVVHGEHVMERDMLGHDHGEPDAGVGGLEERVAREGGRHEDHRDVRPGRGYGLGHGVKHGNSFDLGSPLPGGDPGHDLGAEGLHLNRMNRALVPRDPLNDHASVGVHEDAHEGALPSGRGRSAATTACAEAFRSDNAVIPADWSIARPRSSLFPRIRATSGKRSDSGTWVIAATSPFATVSQRVTPPKMFRNTTEGRAFAISRNASVTFAGSSVPPRSRNTPGFPPNWASTSRVAMVSPAPLAITPMSPSSCTKAISFSRAISSSGVRSSRISAYSGWRKPASSSMMTLASRATRWPSTTASGLTSTSSASSSWKAFQRDSSTPASSFD